MAKNTKSEVAVTNETMPAFLKGKGNQGRGSEEVGAEDLVIPRLELVQSLSKCRKKSDPSFIVGAEEGMLYNNLTRELYGAAVNVIPCAFKKEWLLWRDQELGGGFAGAHGSIALAEAERMNQEDPDEWESVETHQHFCRVVHDDGRSEEVVISMAKSKMKKSKEWNSLVRINGGDRFTRWYTFEGIPAVNAKNQDYFNVKVVNGGFVSEEQYNLAEATYESVKSGVAKADYSFEDEGGAEETEL